MITQTNVDESVTENTQLHCEENGINSVALHIKKSQREFPTRYIIGFMLFLVCISSYILRSSFSISMLAMVNVYDENGTLIVQPYHGPTNDWNSYEQGLLLGAFYYPFVLTTVPFGLVLDRYTVGKQFVFVAYAVCAVLLALSPLAATSGSFGWLLATRLLIGAAQGGTYPYVHRLISRWAPPTELGAFVLTFCGYPLGTMLSWIVAGSVIEAWGWQWSFYVDAAMMTAFLGLWAYNVYDSPARHPRISAGERDYIELSKQLSTEAEAWPPMGKILCSKPFWALLMLSFGNDWFWYLMMTGVPIYMNQILGFAISSTGLLAAVPYMASILGIILFGLAGDYLRRRQIMSVIGIRKSFLVFSHILPSLLILYIAFVPADQPYWCVTMIVLAFFFNGAIVQTMMANAHDLGPEFAASTMAIVDSVSSSNGFISPLVVAFFTRDRNTVQEWRHIFICGAVINTLCMLWFMCLCSATDQKWSVKRSARVNITIAN